MTATTTFVNLQNRVTDMLGKSDSTTVNRVKNWLNMGQFEFVARENWPFRETTGSLATVSSTQEYSLSSNFSDLDAQNIIAVSIQGASHAKLAYWPYDRFRIDQPDFDYEGTGVPSRYYIKAGSIGFWLVPNAVFTVAIDYFKLPTEMSADSDASIIPLAYRQSLVHYALSKEHDYNTDPDLAVKEMNSFEQSIQAARNSLLGQPFDNGNFTILGPQDFTNWSGLYNNEAR